MYSIVLYMSPYVEIQDVKYFMGYQKFQILAVRNCSATFQDTEHDK